MNTLTARKVRVTDNKLGSKGARLSNTASGKAQSMANHPAGKGRTRERSVYEGLLLGGITEEQARFADEESDKWLAEYDEKRLEIQARLDGQAMIDAQRRKDFLRHSDYDSGLTGVIVPSRVVMTQIASSDIVSWFSE